MIKLEGRYYKHYANMHLAKVEFVLLCMIIVMKKV